MRMDTTHITPTREAREAAARAYIAKLETYDYETVLQMRDELIKRNARTRNPQTREATQIMLDLCSVYLTWKPGGTPGWA